MRVPENGVTRREFEKLADRVDQIDRSGSQEVRTLSRVMDERLKGLHEDMEALDRRWGALTKIASGIFLALFAGLITILTALITGAWG